MLGDIERGRHIVEAGTDLLTDEQARRLAAGAEFFRLAQVVHDALPRQILGQATPDVTPLFLDNRLRLWSGSGHWVGGADLAGGVNASKSVGPTNFSERGPYKRRSS